MCGIAGILGHGEGAGVVRAMTGRLRHRGPDAFGYREEEPHLALGHARLSIIDLSPAGAQPMESASGRYVITFNGEIYNFQEIRKRYPDYPYRGHSDTETMLALLDARGPADFAGELTGMFALAVWDRRERRLHLFRDRAGEKPLYYYRGAGGVFAFASELKSLRVVPDFDAAIDTEALTQYFRFGYIPAPRSIYRRVRKLPPAGHLVVDETGKILSEERFWRLPPIGAGASLSEAEALETLHAKLRDSVRRQMVADVPLGAFLSGGLDSSLVVALMQSLSSSPVKTFTIGFRENEYDEAPYAKRIAAHLGTDHTELYLQARDSLELIPHLQDVYDEPFSDPSAVPTLLVSRLARGSVTVSLSGDAGDELFCGYTRYRRAAGIWKYARWIPGPVGGLTGRMLAATGGRLPGLSANKIAKLRRVFDTNSLADLYCGVLSHWSDPARLVPGGREDACFPDWSASAGASPMERFMQADFGHYLPDDILVKVDRAAMFHSLETRVPLLDHGLVEFVWGLPLEFKYREGETKWALRRILYDYVPREMMERPKMGFAVPIADWIKGELRDWAEDLLDEDGIRAAGLLDPEPVRRLWREHREGRHDWSYLLWDVLMFNAWLEAQAS